MKSNRAEEAEKGMIFERDIQPRYEELAGYPLEGDRRERVLAMPISNLKQLADELRQCKNRKTATTAVVHAFTDHERDVRVADRARDAHVGPATISMSL